MPLGLDTPSTFGMVFFVLGPAFLQARESMPVEEAARHTWHIGICAILISGLFKLACAVGFELDPPDCSPSRAVWFADGHRPGVDQFPASGRDPAHSDCGAGRVGDHFEYADWADPVVADGSRGRWPRWWSPEACIT